MKKIIVETEERIRLDKFLSEHTEYSRSRLAKMLEQGCILLNGETPKASSKVSFQDEIEILKEYKEELDLTPEEIPIEIVYESKNVLVVNKPSGMVVHPGSGNHHGTLVHALLYHTKDLSDCNGMERPGIVHRIDKDTSGLLIVAKNNKAHELLGEEFKRHAIHRKYIALVKGILKHNHITIDAPIGRDEENRKKMKVTDKNSKSAITHVNVLKRYDGFTLVECILETGRTHQIRVHMSYIGYPLWNDPVYGKEAILGFGQFLHSSELSFIEPITKEELHFEVPLPKEFQNFINTLEEIEKKEI